LPERLHRRAKLAAAWSGVKLQEFVACAVEQQLTRVEGEMNEANHRSLPPPKRKTR
jgi:hypothetical protein